MLQRAEAGASRTRVAVVGAGLTGLVTADGLMRLGHLVDLFESSPSFGGLIGGAELAGDRVDRFYHVIQPSDRHIISLARDLNMGVRFSPLRSAIAHSGGVEPLSGAGDVARLSLLGPVERTRTAAFAAYCRAGSGGSELDTVRALDWLRRWVGRGAVNRLWTPLLRARFGDLAHDLPAQWLYQRIHRAGLARRRGVEMHGAIDGGYEMLVERLAARLLVHGGTIRLSCPVDAVMPGEPASLYAQGERFDYDVIILATPDPVTDTLLRRPPSSPVGERSLGVVCLRLALRRALSPYYSISVADPHTRITSVIEAGHVVDPDGAAGHSITYIPRYVSADDPILLAPDERVEADLMASLQRIFPGFDPVADVVDSQVARADFVEQVRHAGHPTDATPFRASSLPGIVVATGSQLWPRPPSCDTTVQLARTVVASIGRQLLSGRGGPLGGYAENASGDEAAVAADSTLP